MAWVAVNGWWWYESVVALVVVAVLVLAVYMRRRRANGFGLPRRERIFTGSLAGLATVIVVLVLVWSTPPWWGYILGGAVVAIVMFARVRWSWRPRTETAG